MKITNDMKKEEVINFLKTKNFDPNILSKIDEEEIDGESLILLRKDDFEKLGIKFHDRKKITEHIDKDVFKIDNNIRKNIKYKKIFEDDFKNLWNCLDDELKNLKLGEKLKFIKYLIIRDFPPGKDETNDLFNYIQRILKLEESLINKIIQNINDLLSYDEKDFEDICDEWKLSNEQKFKLKIILELIKQKNEKRNISKNLNESNNNNEEKQNEKNNKNNEKYCSSTDKYLFYSMIEIYNYETSQDEITTGLQNPINEFQKLCDDFKINCQNNCTFIDYNEAYKYKLSSFMIWGSKESLYQFFKDNNIKEALNYFEKNNDKEGIYLCLNVDKNIGFLIIWPGKLNYDCEEPSNSILLTLVN